MTVEATNNLSVWATASNSTKAIGVEAQGNQGTIIGGPVSADSLTFWRVSFNDDLTGWTYQASAKTQSGLAEASSTAPTLSFSAGPTSITAGASSTLSWSSSNGLACTGSGFLPLLGSGSASVSPSETTTYGINCTNGFGSTTRSTSLNVNPFPTTMSWTQSLPVTFGNPAIVPFGGTEMRFLLFMDGSLYAGIGDWEDPQLQNSQTPGAQVLQLDSPNSGWVEDQDFNQVQPSTGEKYYQAIAALEMAHFDHNSGNNPITPVDVLMAGFYNLDKGGVSIAQKTVKTGSVGAQGTWTMNSLVPLPAAAGQIRSFGSYTDSVTGVEMAFAGSDPYGIFSGGFNSATNTVAWGSTAEAGSIIPTANDGDGLTPRVMAFAACGGKLYASIYYAIVVRTDGPNPSWSIVYQYSGPDVSAVNSGFRGLTCVPNLNGSGSMLIASLEGPGDVYEFPLDGSPPTIELYMSNYLSSQLGSRVSYATAAYNNMVIYPQSGTPSCPDLLMGLGFIASVNYPHAYDDIYPNASFIVRHCNGTYTPIANISNPSIMPAPQLMATRSIAVSQFNGDPPGTLYAGGFEVDVKDFPLDHNTDWIYKGVPQSPAENLTKR